MGNFCVDEWLGKKDCVRYFIIFLFFFNLIGICLLVGVLIRIRSFIFWLSFCSWFVILKVIKFLKEEFLIKYGFFDCIFNIVLIYLVVIFLISWVLIFWLCNFEFFKL